jgi:hypothetical protein
MSRSWRWRKCLRCGEVAPAGDFEVVGSYGQGWGSGGADRRCPGCGLVDQTDAFIVVREKHQERAGDGAA